MKPQAELHRAMKNIGLDGEPVRQMALHESAQNETARPTKILAFVAGITKLVDRPALIVSREIRSECGAPNYAEAEALCEAPARHQ